MSLAIPGLLRVRLLSLAGVLCACLLTFGAGPVSAGSWTGTLQDGSVLKVDPDSRRPMRYYNGGVAPIWDGTHRLENGSVVIVRDGAIVPTEGMLDRWAAQPGARPGMRERYCDQLVRKVCGFKHECSASGSCTLARQLLRMEREEQRRASFDAGPFPHTESTRDCSDALTNAAFPACTASLPDWKETDCTKLVDRVCGKDDRCADSAGCDPARQLLQMENQERLESADPGARTPAGAECRKAWDNVFFKPCEQR